jgi:hypothetical protein
LEIAEVDVSGGLSTGRHRDHPRRRALVEPVEEQLGEQERGEMVQRERQLEAVGGDVARVPVATDVVDQYVPVALPMPPVPPVTRTVRPVIRPSWPVVI